ncbi:MAG: tetratricopeptide repeat protein [Bacteroidota bacterium]
MYKIYLFLAYIMSLTAFAQNRSMEADSLIQARHYPLAESLLKEELKLSPDKNVRNRLGEVYGLQGKWDKAISIYKTLSADYPEVATYAFRYGGALAKKAQESGAFTALTLVGKIKENLKRAVTLDPEYIEGYWALVDLYVSLPGILGGSTSKALDYAFELKKISPVEGCFALGYVYEYDDSSQKAKTYYMQALTLVGGLDTINRNAMRYQIGKASADYEWDLDRGLIHMQNYIDAYSALDGVPLKWAFLRMAQLYRKKGDKDKAKEWLLGALEKDPEFAYALEEKVKIELMETGNGL